MLRPHNHVEVRRLKRSAPAGFSFKIIEAIGGSSHVVDDVVDIDCVPKSIRATPIMVQELTNV